MTAENPEREVTADDQVTDTADATASAASPEAAEAGATESDDLSAITAELEKASTELGYAKAEIANIRRNALARIDRAVEDERVSVVSKFLDLVDDLDRARAHGDLETGPLKALSDKLSGVLDGLGLAGSARRATRSPRICTRLCRWRATATTPCSGTCCARATASETGFSARRWSPSPTASLQPMRQPSR